MNLVTTPVDMVWAADTIDPQRPRDHTKPHVTDLIRQASKVGRSGADSPLPTTGILEMGRIWEFATRPILAREAYNRGCTFEDTVYLEKDGIIASLDGRLNSLGKLVGSNGTQAIVETKLRFTRGPEDPRGNWKWMKQVQSYAYMEGVTDVLMLVGYISHSPPGTAIYMYDLKFAEHETAETWQMLLNMKRHGEAQ
jgi:hypothetical protein